ncbi:TRAPP III complex [Babesia duncani]|uniref:TRAPP III complex n=1 Tax=Babesia duncani TaxID=323732 RepID=A0AAD9UP93_9APIC|nr:TRAPP III complex [Babesia duncani]
MQSLLINMPSGGKNDHVCLDGLIEFLGNPQVLVRATLGFSRLCDNVTQTFNRLSAGFSGIRFMTDASCSFINEDDFEAKLLSTLSRYPDPGYPLPSNHQSEFSPWFLEWALVLSGLTRAALCNKANVGPECDGLIVCCCVDDPVDLVSSFLDSAANTPRALVAVGSPERTAQLLGELQATVDLSVAVYACESLTDYQENLASFLTTFKRRCIQQLDQIASEDSGDLKKTFAAMIQELHAGRGELLQSVLRKHSSDTELMATAYFFRGILYIKSELGILPNGALSIKNISESILKDLETAASLYLKANSKWLCIMAAVTSVIYGGYMQVAKFGSISAVLETKNSSDYARAALSLELCATFSSKPRKRIFHLVMAGHLYSQAGLSSLAQRCYEITLIHYRQRNWTVAVQHLYDILCKINCSYSVDALNAMVASKNYQHLSNPDIAADLGQQESSILRKIFNLKTLDHNPNCEIAPCMHGQYRLIIGDLKPPPLDSSGKMPFLLSIPKVHLENSAGVFGKSCNCTLLNVKLREDSFYIMDQFSLQSHLMHDHMVQTIGTDLDLAKYVELCNLYMFENRGAAGHSIPCQIYTHIVKHSGHNMILTVDLVNPLHIPIQIDEFTILLQDSQGNKSWLPSTLYSGEASLDLNALATQRLCLKFSVERTGKFTIIGLGWDLMGCISCWAPLYLVGPQILTNGTKCCFTLDEYLSTHHHDTRLRFEITETLPRINVTMTTACAELDPSATQIDGGNHWEIVKQLFSPSDLCYHSEYAMGQLTTSIGTPSFESLQVTSGQYVLWRCDVENVSETTICKMSISIKSTGRFTCPGIVLAYRGAPENVVVTTSGGINVNTCNSKPQHYKGMITTTTLEHESLLPEGSIVSMYMLSIPHCWVPDSACILVKITVYSQLKESYTESLMRLYKIEPGLLAHVDLSSSHAQASGVCCTLANQSSSNIVVQLASCSPMDGKNREIALAAGCREHRLLISQLGGTPFEMYWRASGNENNGARGFLSFYPRRHCDAQLEINVSRGALTACTDSSHMLDLTFNILNIGEQSLDACIVEAVNGPGEGTGAKSAAEQFSFVGIVSQPMKTLEVGQAHEIKFTALLYSLGLYTFGSHNIKFRTRAPPRIQATHNRLIVMVE